MSGSGGNHDLWVLRHGATEWSQNGRHTGRTDVALTDRGRRQAEGLARVLDGRPFARVLVSPLTRARETCALAGYGDQAEVDEDLREWDYGDYEGITTEEIRRSQPGWTVWSAPCPGGETITQVAARADRVIARARAAGGDVALFAHGHILRMVTARWCRLEPVEGRCFPLDTGTVNILGWEHESPAILRWNDPALEPACEPAAGRDQVSGK
ncbi:MAG TPA: histidine phosphatase family protein [Acidimicrobiales bacterium]